MSAQHIEALRSLLHGATSGDLLLSTPEYEALHAAIAALAAPKEAGDCPHCDGPPKTYFKDYVPCRHCKGSGRFNGVTEAPASAFRIGDQHVGACPDASPKRQVANPADSTYTANPPGDQRQEGEWPCMTFDGHRVQCEPAIRQQVECALLEWGMRERAKHEAASPPPEAAAAVGEDLLAGMSEREGLLVRAVSLYEDAIDMMFDGPDDSDEGYAKARWIEARKLVAAALAAPTGPQPAGGGVDEAVVERAAEAIKAIRNPNCVSDVACVAFAEAALAAIKGDSHAG